jgi:hypothetical protein
VDIGGTVGKRGIEPAALWGVEKGERIIFEAGELVVDLGDSPISERRIVSFYGPKKERFYTRSRNTSLKLTFCLRFEKEKKPKRRCARPYH